MCRAPIFEPQGALPSQTESGPHGHVGVTKSLAVIKLTTHRPVRFTSTDVKIHCMTGANPPDPPEDGRLENTGGRRNCKMFHFIPSLNQMDQWNVKKYHTIVLKLVC